MASVRAALPSAVARRSASRRGPRLVRYVSGPWPFPTSTQGRVAQLHPARHDRESTSGSRKVSEQPALSVIRLAATIDCDARQHVPDTKAGDCAQGRVTKYLETSVHSCAAN